MHASLKPLNAAVALALLSAVSAATLAAPPAGAPYYTDPQESHVEDATSRGIEQVNMITCIVNAMRPDALVNDGDYIALVDQQKCDPRARSSAASSAGASDAAQAPAYMTATVRSTRTSNDEPMRVRAWLDDAGEDMSEATIFVNMTATAPPSASTPYGVFRLDYCGRGVGMQGCMMQGYLEGATDGLSYYEIESDDEQPRTVALRLSSVGATTGSGRMELHSQWEGDIAFMFSYDASYFRRSDGGGDQCFSRDASDPDTGLSVWRYGLYDADTGERITRNSGFPIEYTANGQTYHGYLSYWGLSLPPEAGSPANGAEVIKVDYSSGNEGARTPYTLARAGGKLMKFSKHTRSLADIDKIRFNTWVSDTTGFFSGAEPHSQYVLYWDNGAGVFKATARMNCGAEGCNTEMLEAEQPVSHTFWSGQGGVRGWSEALGGELFIDLRAVGGTIAASAVDVIYRQQEVVYPDEAPTTLYCLRDCPTAATLAAYFETGSTEQSPFIAETANRFGAASSAIVYGLNEGVLKDAVNGDVVMTDAELMRARPMHQWGVRTGRLFTDLAAAECDFAPGSYCESEVDALDTFYAWETGAGQWNQFAAVKDAAGEFVIFEAPLQLNYQTPNDPAYGDYAGKMLVLQYGGFGDLWGIPGHCVSRLTNEAVDCQTEDSRYVPAFVIPYDASVGRVTAGDATYLVKWLQREIRFARKAPATCAALALPDNVTLPTTAGLNDPSDPNATIFIGDKPSVTSAPRVIHGEVKY